MLLVVGLGNPGQKYAATRHNVGFMVVELLAERFKAGPFREKFSGVFARSTSPDVALLKPQTFMNLSGESVQQAMQFFKVELKDVLVVHDELDVPFGECRLKQGGGAAGHNGLRSIMQHCGGEGFPRLRVGIGRPRGEGVSHVLGEFSASEKPVLGDVLQAAALGVETILAKGVAQAMNTFNARDKKPRS
ncbi:MAG: aminoacyl-tRNA hydrolase [Myxococcales bacterium]